MKLLMCSGKLARWVMLVLLNFCALTTGSQAANITYNPTTLNFSPAGPYSLPSDKTVGSQLATASVNITAIGIAVLCQLTVDYTVTGTQTSTPGIYTTGVNGIGMKFYVHNLDDSTTLITSAGQTRTINVPLLGSTPLPGINAELVVYGQVATGSLSSSPPHVNVQVSGNTFLCLTFNGTDQVNTHFSNPAVTAITCSVTTPSVSVTLPNISTTSLSSVGQTTGDTRFDIGLNCNSGANVYVTLTDATTPGNTTSLLSLKPSSTAAGVKLRILKSDGNPVSFGPDSAAAGNTNQWLVGSSASVNDIPLTVQYYRDGALTAGTVNAAATFTMSYQ